MSHSTRTEFLRSLRTVPIDSLPEGQRTCAVCQDDYSDDDRPMTLSCGHTFGETCLRTWFDGTNRSGIFNNCCPYKCMLYRYTDSGAPPDMSTYENEAHTHMPPSTGYATDTLARDQEDYLNAMGLERERYIRGTYGEDGYGRVRARDHFHNSLSDRDRMRQLEREIAELEESRQREIDQLADVRRRLNDGEYGYYPRTPAFGHDRVEQRSPRPRERTPFSSFDLGEPSHYGYEDSRVGRTQRRSSEDYDRGFGRNSSASHSFTSGHGRHDESSSRPFTGGTYILGGGSSPQSYTGRSYGDYARLPAQDQRSGYYLSPPQQPSRTDYGPAESQRHFGRRISGGESSHHRPWDREPDEEEEWDDGRGGHFSRRVYYG